MVTTLNRHRCTCGKDTTRYHEILGVLHGFCDECYAKTERSMARGRRHIVERTEYDLRRQAERMRRR